MCCDRRTFVRQSLGLAGVLIVGDRDAVAFSQVAPAAKRDLIAGMEWMNSPESVKREGDKLIVHARFFGLVDDARSFLRGAGLVARGPQKRFD